MRREELRLFQDVQAPHADSWHAKNRYYHESLERILRFHIPPGSKVIEIGCGTGDLLHSLAPVRGVGIDISPKMIEIARSKYPDLDFLVGDAEDLPLSEPFDYVILSDVIGYMEDVQRAFEQIRKVCHEGTRVIVTYYNYLWEPVLRAGERLGMKRPQPDQNWLAPPDIQNLLSLAGFQTIRIGHHLLFPFGFRSCRPCATASWRTSRCCGSFASSRSSSPVPHPSRSPRSRSPAR